MQAKDIQNIVEGAIKMVGAHKMMSTNVSLSDEPDHPDVRQTVNRPIYICGAIMTKAEYFRFRGICNMMGVWVRAKHWEMDSDKFEYSITASEMWGSGVVRAFLPFLLAVGITAGYLLVKGYVHL